MFRTKTLNILLFFLITCLFIAPVFADTEGTSNGTATVTEYVPPPTPHEFDDPLFQYLLNFDLIGFVFACYTSIIGPLAFGIPLLFISTILYIRQKSLFIVSIIWILVGGSFIASMMELSFFAVAFTIFGLAGVFVQLILSWSK